MNSPTLELPKSSPLSVNMLLHFYAVAEDYPHPSQAADEERERLIRVGLVYFDPHTKLYRTTSHGECAVYSILMAMDAQLVPLKIHFDIPPEPTKSTP